MLFDVITPRPKFSPDDVIQRSLMEHIVTENAMFNLMFTVLEQYTEKLHSKTIYINNILCCHVVDFNPNGTVML